MIEFKNPPPDPRKTGSWDDVAPALKERAGEWALVKSNTGASVATSIKQGRYASFRPSGAFEATVRLVSPGKYDIYARYVGEVSA